MNIINFMYEFVGIHTNVFTTTWHVDAWNADLDVKYHWSDPKTWTGTSGTGASVPVAVMFSGTAMTKENTTVEIDEVIEFQSFFEVNCESLKLLEVSFGFLKVKSGKEIFEPPADMVCEGRSLDDRLPMIPNYYEYGSELIFHYTHDDHMHKVVSPRNNWYDQEMQVARLDYKPLVLDHENHGDPYDSMVGVQTDIQDFIAGISYQIDTNYGNCSIVPINLDLAGDLNVADGRIQTPDPMHIFFTDTKFAYNGIVRSFLKAVS